MKLKRLRPFFAGLLLFALVSLSLPAYAQSPGDPGGHTKLIVFADRRIADQVWPLLTETLDRESAIASLTNPIDGHPDIILGAPGTPGPQLPDRIEVQLLGRCDVLPQAYRPLLPGPLGWVYFYRGRIQPDIHVDCTRLAQVISPTTQSMSMTQRMQAMSQAISNIIVHEWIHVATQSSAHTSHGVSQSQLSALELISPTLIGAIPTQPQKMNFHDFASVVRSKPEP